MSNTAPKRPTRHSTCVVLTAADATRVRRLSAVGGTVHVGYRHSVVPVLVGLLAHGRALLQVSFPRVFLDTSAKSQWILQRECAGARSVLCGENGPARNPSCAARVPGALKRYLAGFTRTSLLATFVQRVCGCACNGSIHIATGAWSGSARNGLGVGVARCGVAWRLMDGRMWEEVRK